MDFNEYIGRDMTERERENVNGKLDSIFKNSEVRSHLSRLHPELSPRFISVEFGSDNRPHWVMVGFETIVGGEYDPGWYSQGINRDLAYVDDILDFFKDRDPDFHHFLRGVV